MRRATSVAAVAIGTALLAAPIAGARVTGPSAEETIARLQDEGNRVVVDRLGTGPLADCTVTSQRTRSVDDLPVGDPLFGIPFMPRVTVVHVRVQC